MTSKATTYVRYNGRASTRGFTEADFQKKGITDQGDVEFNHDNRWVTEVSPEAAGLLIGMGEFTKVDKKEADALHDPENQPEPVQTVPSPGEVLPGQPADRDTAQQNPKGTPLDVHAPQEMADDGPKSKSE